PPTLGITRPVRHRPSGQKLSSPHMPQGLSTHRPNGLPDPAAGPHKADWLRASAPTSAPKKTPGMSRRAPLSTVARAGFGDGVEFESRGAGRLGDEILYRGVLARLEVGPRGRGDTNVTLHDGPCLCGRELPEGVVVPVTAAAQPDLPGGARIEHPRHGAVRGDQPPLLALHDKDHRGGARPAGLPAAGGQHMGWPDPGRGENAEDRIADPVAAALAVLAHRPGSAVPGWVHLPGGMSVIVGPALAAVLVIVRSGARHGLLLWRSRSSRPRGASAF